MPMNGPILGCMCMLFNSMCTSSNSSHSKNFMEWSPTLKLVSPPQAVPKAQVVLTAFT